MVLWSFGTRIEASVCLSVTEAANANDVELSACNSEDARKILCPLVPVADSASAVPGRNSRPSRLSLRGIFSGNAYVSIPADMVAKAASL